MWTGEGNEKEPAEAGSVLFDLLFKVVEEGRVEEVLDGDFKSVTDFFDGGDGGRVISTGDDIIQGWLSQTADVG